MSSYIQSVLCQQVLRVEFWPRARRRLPRLGGALPGRSSIGGSAAGNIEGRRGGKRALFTGQPTNQSHALLYVAEPSHRNLRTHVIDLALRHLREYRAL